MSFWEDWEDGWADFWTCPDPTIVDRKMFRGDTLTFQIQIFQPYPFQNSPQNLTGWFLQFTLKRWFPDQDPQALAVSKSTGVAPNVIVFPNGLSAGLVQVSSGPSNTLTLGDGIVRGVYDIQGIDPSGNVTTLEIGRMRIMPDVTRAIVPS
jgi:hypothetical protein